MTRKKRTTLFLLGRPGAGKSLVTHLVYNHLTAMGLPSEAIYVYDDYEILWQWFQGDNKQDGFEAGVKGGFQIKRYELLDECLRRLNKRAVEARDHAAAILLEFSRSNYIDALKTFDQRLLTEALIVYVYAPLDLCLERNEERLLCASNGKGYVPREVIETYYAHDDVEEVRHSYGFQFIWIDNSVRGTGSLEREVTYKVLPAIDL